MLLQLKIRLHPLIHLYSLQPTASGLQNKSTQEQVGTFLYAMGDCADDIVKTLSINEATASFDEVKTALNCYFAARRKRQNPGESVDTFIQDLYPSPKIVSTEL